MQQKSSDGAIMRDLAHLAHVLMRRSRKLHSGYSSGDLLLAFLASHEEAMAEGQADRLLTQTELAAIAGMQPQTVGALLKELEDDGCITRSVCESDRRAFLIDLTPFGRDRSEAVLEGWRRQAASLLSCFDADEKQAFARALRTLNTSLD